MNTELDGVGARIRAWRRRRGGMTQKMLADIVGVTQGYVSKVEGGQLAVERRSTLVAFARALQVSVPELLGQPGDPTDPPRADAASYVPDIRVALIEIGEDEIGKPTRPHEQVAAAVQNIVFMRYDTAAYGAMTRFLAGLIRDAAALRDDVLLARVLYEVSDCLRNLGYIDLARDAAQLGVSAAQAGGVPAWTGAARFIASLAMPPEASALAARAADRAIAELQRDAGDPDVRQVLGQMHLSAAYTNAVAGRFDETDAHLAAADAEAATLGDPADGIGFHAMSFGPTNINLWRLGIAIEVGDMERAVRISNIDMSPLRCATRHFRYHLDVGRALAAAGGRNGEAAARQALVRAERASPLTFAVNPLAREAVATMATRARRSAVPADLRMLAGRVGFNLNRA
jgi:transcriptional regulator with XRE-family HTH domain